MTERSLSMLDKKALKKTLKDIVKDILDFFGIISS